MNRLSKITIAAAACAMTVLAPVASAMQDADTVIARYVEALGGKKAIKSVKSMHQTGTIEIPAQGMVGDVDVKLLAPSEMRLWINIEGFGESVQGYVNGVGYAMDPTTGPRLLEGVELAQMIEGSAIHRPIELKKLYESIEYVGEEEFEGEMTSVLRLIPKEGTESLQYFSLETGLPVGIKVKVESPFGEIDAVSVVSDYKEFGGMKLPMRTVQRVAGMEVVTVLTDVQINTLEQKDFVVPEAIKVLSEDDHAGHDHGDEGHAEEGHGEGG